MTEHVGHPLLSLRSPLARNASGIALPTSWPRSPNSSDTYGTSALLGLAQRRICSPSLPLRCAIAVNARFHLINPIEATRHFPCMPSLGLPQHPLRLTLSVTSRYPYLVVPKRSPFNFLPSQSFPYCPYVTMAPLRPSQAIFRATRQLFQRQTQQLKTPFQRRHVTTPAETNVEPPKAQGFSLARYWNSPIGPKTVHFWCVHTPFIPMKKRI